MENLKSNRHHVQNRGFHEASVWLLLQRLCFQKLRGRIIWIFVYIHSSGQWSKGDWPFTLRLIQACTWTVWYAQGHSYSFCSHLWLPVCPNVPHDFQSLLWPASHLKSEPAAKKAHRTYWTSSFGIKLVVFLIIIDVFFDIWLKLEPVTSNWFRWQEPIMGFR